eukprot:GHVS01048034.1.p1 GENE.GHVS01048034.1~~GHVS01048034.1.p1  ORF type:complete len:340 (+),score=36.52 GHVS01048034.1:510-1529(+)
MSIVGDTIDYGPYGFVEHFNPNHVCNASDDNGRYAYNEQPSACRWNCMKLVEALSPLLRSADEDLPTNPEAHLLAVFDEHYDKCYMDGMRRKLGLTHKKQDEDKSLIEDLLFTMAQSGADWTNTFRALAQVSLLPLVDDGSVADMPPNVERCFHSAAEHVNKFLASLSQLKQIHIKTNCDPNRLYFLLQIARTQPQLAQALGVSVSSLATAEEQLKNQRELAKLSEDEYTARSSAQWTEWLHRYVARLKDDAENFFSGGQSPVAAEEASRIASMNSVNPIVVLRNHLAQRAVEKAEQGDYSEANRLLEVLMRPFDDNHSDADTAPLPFDVGGHVPVRVS